VEVPVNRQRIISALVTGLTTALVASVLVVGPVPTAEAKPTIKVKVVVSGLKIPWDLTWVGDLMLFDQRAGGIWSKRGSADPRRVTIKLPRLHVASEGGMLGLVADPDARANKRFYTCQSTSANGKPRDVRVLRWRLTSDTKAVSDGAPLITGIPTNQGRHNGCRLRFGPDGMLYVGTGDAAIGTNPQKLTSLGGKVLRVDPNGSIPADNPYASRDDNARYVWNYGHRNVQGLAFRPGTGELWSAEHGTDRDDEINLNVAGGNYGWDPVPGYDESTSMTDLGKFPDAKVARWRSGKPTLATSGVTFLASSAWGHWQGAVAIGLLKAEGIRLLFLDPTGRVTSTTTIAGLHKYGRIRTVQFGPDRALYFTTSNGAHDVIAKITPTATPPTVRPGHNVSTTGVSAVRTDGQIYAFVRSTGNQIAYRRSIDDGRNWSPWLGTGLTSTTAPAVASSGPGRVDLLTRASDGSIRLDWFDAGTHGGSTALGGTVITATVSSATRGSLDVLALAPDGTVSRRHFDGTVWSGWRRLSGGGFTSAVGASVDVVSGDTLITARGRSGGIYERRLTATSDGSGWTGASGLLWSARALGDRFSGRPLVAVSRGSDGYLRWQQGGLIQGLGIKITSDPDVVTRPDGTWVAFGRSTSGGLVYYDARPGEYAGRSLGGTVR
jgi:glucose/arabinose dehydrogenase